MKLAPAYRDAEGRVWVVSHVERQADEDRVVLVHTDERVTEHAWFENPRALP